MLERHCSLEPGRLYNLPQGKLLDYLLANHRAIVVQSGDEAVLPANRPLPGLVIADKYRTKHPEFFKS